MQEFSQNTKNKAIFELNTPYDNPFQGNFPRWLIVCSAGLLRSPTGAWVAEQRGINARSCGSHLDYALIPISSNLVHWAHQIVFVTQEVYEESLQVFSTGQPNPLVEMVQRKRKVLNIPDMYNYRDPELIKLFEQQMFEPQPWDI